MQKISVDYDGSAVGLTLNNKIVFTKNIINGKWLYVKTDSKFEDLDKKNNKTYALDENGNLFNIDIIIE